MAKFTLIDDVQARRHFLDRLRGGEVSRSLIRICPLALAAQIATSASAGAQVTPSAGNQQPRPMDRQKEIAFHCCDQSCISRTGSCKLSRRCDAPSDERSAGKLHATFCGSRGRVTAPGHPVRGRR
jgi:hypothetical protein